MRKILLWVCLLCTTAKTYAQNDAKTTIAVLPFVNGGSNYTEYSNLMQEMVTKEFVKGSRFVILDRSKFQTVLQELNVQKSEEFLNSKVVEQGRLVGAQYLVTGVLNQADARKDVSTYYDPVTKQNKVSVKWVADVKFSFQVIDVATSSAVYAENIAATNSANHNGEASDAMNHAMCRLKSQVKMAVMKFFPQEIQIVGIEKADKKGLPESVLISAGANYFDENYKGGNECDKNVMDKITNIFAKKEHVKMKVVEIEMISLGDKEMKREKTIGMLKLDKVEGDFAICKVDEGEKEIGERLTAKKKLLVKIL